MNVRTQKKTNKQDKQTNDTKETNTKTTKALDNFVCLRFGAACCAVSVDTVSAEELGEFWFVDTHVRAYATDEVLYELLQDTQSRVVLLCCWSSKSVASACWHQEMETTARRPDTANSACQRMILWKDPTKGILDHDTNSAKPQTHSKGAFSALSLTANTTRLLGEGRKAKT
jgi:hypothetical protein